MCTFCGQNVAKNFDIPSAPFDQNISLLKPSTESSTYKNAIFARAESAKQDFFFEDQQKIHLNRSKQKKGDIFNINVLE